MTELARRLRSSGRSLVRRIETAAQARHDGAALGAFRILFGLLITASSVRFLAYGWVEFFFVEPSFRFTYFGFGFVPRLPPPYIHGVFAALAVLGVLVTLGLFYRVAMGLFFLGFCYVHLIDVTTYLNHYYLVCLLAGLLLLLPAGRVFSLDNLRHPARRLETVPAYATWLLRFQVAVVYVFAGLAKATSDWLVHAQPLNIWLSARTDLPIVGPFLGTREVAYAASWAGFLFDTTVVVFLAWRRSRPFAYLAVLLFHAGTFLLFPIGMFPFIMVTAALVFFSPSWPRVLGRTLGRLLRPGRAVAAGVPLAADSAAGTAAMAPRRLSRLAVTAVGLYAFLQVALPLRAFAYDGNVLWHEQGMRFSWRVMAREKNGTVEFNVRDPRTGREWIVSPWQYLNRLQEREMSVQPDLILQLAHHIENDFQARGHPAVEVRADAWVSLNGRAPARFIDPTVDLAQIQDGLGKKDWILSAPETPPIHLRPLARIEP